VAGRVRRILVIYPGKPTRCDVKRDIVSRVVWSTVGIGALEPLCLCHNSSLDASDFPDYRPAVSWLLRDYRFSLGKMNDLAPLLETTTTLEWVRLADDYAKRFFGFDSASRNFERLSRFRAIYHTRPSAWIKLLMIGCVCIVELGRKFLSGSRRQSDNMWQCVFCEDKKALKRPSYI